MSLNIVHLAARIESHDDFHVARLILLLRAAAGRTNKPVEGIMKLAKMDFLLRYPNCLIRAMQACGKPVDVEFIIESEQNTIETRMIRFRYGPWDKRYRRWLSILSARQLAVVQLKGKTVNIRITQTGQMLAERIARLDEFGALDRRSQLVASCVGSFSATKLKDFVYRTFPEIVGMRWGESIEL